MAKIRFVKNNEHCKLLDAVGVPYGLILGAESKKVWLIRSLEAGNIALEDLLEKKLVAEDQVQRMLKDMLMAELESIPGIHNKIIRFSMPPNFSSSFNFGVCTNPTCPRPLAHGHIYDNNGGKITKEATSLLTDGFEICEGLAQLGGANTLDGIKLFQQMLAADLSANKTEWYQRYKELSKQTRYKFEEDRGKAIVKELFDGLRHSEKIFADN